MQETEKNTSQTSQEKLKYAIGGSAVSMAGFVLAAVEADQNESVTAEAQTSQTETTTSHTDSAHTQSETNTAATVLSSESAEPVVVEVSDTAEPIEVTISNVTLEDMAESVVMLDNPSTDVYETPDISIISDTDGNFAIDEITIISQEDILTDEANDIDYLAENAEFTSNSDYLLEDQYTDNPTGDLIDDIDLNNAEFI